jgi:hypothetical protein
MTDRELMQDALEAMEAAIQSGDWKVDGACDPDAVLNRLRNRLAQSCRRWAGLTDKEIYLIAEYPICCEVSIRNAEAKLKEKNT